MLFLLLACTAPSDDGGKDETAGDTGDTGDTGTPTATCPAYSGLTAAGRMWTWGLTAEALEAADGFPTETRIRVETLDAEGNWRLSLEQRSAVGSEYESATEGVQEGGCDGEGAWLGSQSTLTTFLDGTQQTTVRTYSEPWYFLPAELSVGAMWDAHVVGTQETQSGARDLDYYVDYEVVAATTVTVSAGTFETFEISSAISGSASSRWAHADVGDVLSATFELVSVTE